LTYADMPQLGHNGQAVIAVISGMQWPLMFLAT
jgi:hypothetical protein